MNPLPPPAPIAEPPTTPPTGSRRRLVLAAAAATALGVGGVVAGSTLASADDEPAGDETIDDETGGGDTTDDVEPVDELPMDDEHDGDGTWDMPSLDELDAAFEDFDACLSEQLPDVVGGGWSDVEGGEFPDLEQWTEEFEDLLGGMVTVFSPGADGGDLTLLEFGEGDGTITITQTDGEITVSTDGDVADLETSLPDLGDLDLGDLDLGDLDLGDFDLGDFDLGDFDLGDMGFEPDPEFTAALEECTALLPGGGIFDMIGEFVDDFEHTPADGDSSED